jgi:hypothetical protein
MQQERDKVAAAYAASQQAMQTSAQVAEIRQQLTLLQAKIQSMQPPQAPVTNPNHMPPTYQNEANNSLATPAPTMSIPPALTSVTSKTTDPNPQYSKVFKLHIGQLPTSPSLYQNTMASQILASSS